MQDAPVTSHRDDKPVLVIVRSREPGGIGKRDTDAAAGGEKQDDQDDVPHVPPYRAAAAEFAASYFAETCQLASDAAPGFTVTDTECVIGLP